MEKNKIYFFIVYLILSFYFISCSGNNLKKGKFYSKVCTDVGFEASKIKAIDSIYYYISKETGYIINRNDFNILSISLKDNNLIDFNDEDIVSIKEYKKDNYYYVEIKVNDNNIYSNTLQVLNTLKKEGSIGEKIFRANASIEISENAKLNAYTRQMLTQNALKRAYESLFKILRNNCIEVNKAVTLTNNAYILEESYSSNEYNVVIETIIE